MSLALTRAADRLELRPASSNGWVRVHSPGQAGMVYTLQASTNLLQWSPIATLHDSIQNFPDAASGLWPSRFYHSTAAAKRAEDDWKNQIHFPTDLFESVDGQILNPDVRWVKFAIVLNNPYRVHFQDSHKYDFHYDWAVKRLEGFLGMTHAEFDQVSLRTNAQQVLLGSVLYPPYPNDTEYGIQFVGQDAYEPEFIARYFELVKAAVAVEAGSSAVAFYVPTFEQSKVAEARRDWFAARGIAVTGVERWTGGNDIYAPGWAVGRLVFIPGTEIAAAFTDGRLRPGDILLTDGVPAEIPVLAGVLSLTPSTPNSHVAILSKSFGLPFAYLSDPAERERVKRLAGKDIMLRVDTVWGEIRVTQLDPTIDPALKEEILGLKEPPRLKITAKERYGAVSSPTQGLTPADVRYFGGKASNFGFLRRAIPGNSPEAIALSFDLWDDFLDQKLPNGKTLRAEIGTRLGAYTYPPNVAAVKADLAAVRELITGTAKFSDAQKRSITNTLSGFDATRNIRFRSSTNVEDSEQFTGAGLYDSFSGCLWDDLDGDDSGPCRCDPTEKKERGVFRAIQKVYASFYNDNAFIERLRHEVNEAEVGMAILVHHSTPDEFELANGVATVQVDRGTGYDNIQGELVTQKGATSVTNPDGTALPEVVQGYKDGFSAGAFVRQRSNLTPLGATVLTWKTEYVDLINLLNKVADAVHGYYPAKKRFTLDFEYKKETTVADAASRSQVVTEGKLNIKQVREVPVSRATNQLPAFLLGETNEHVVFQGEAADVFSNHRLKSMWSFVPRSLKLSGTNLNASLFESLTVDYVQGGGKHRLSGAPSTLPMASHKMENDYAVDRWVGGDGSEMTDFALRTEIRRTVGPDQIPVLNLRDFQMNWEVVYGTQQPVLMQDFDGLKPGLTGRHVVTLIPKRTVSAYNPLQQRTMARGALKIESSFWWSSTPNKAIIEKTASLMGWKETRIEGLTTAPIVLRGEFSQTYRPGHHNFYEEFIFEPALEEGLSEPARAELQTANVKFIHVLWNFDEAMITILGLDGKFRTIN